MLVLVPDPGNFLGSSLRKLNYIKFNKEITWIYQHHKKNKKWKYMNYYNFFLLTKRERNVLIRNKVGIENAKIRVIK